MSRSFLNVAHSSTRKKCNICMRLVWLTASAAVNVADFCLGCYCWFRNCASVVVTTNEACILSSAYYEYQPNLVSQTSISNIYETYRIHFQSLELLSCDAQRKCTAKDSKDSKIKLLTPILDICVCSSFENVFERRALNFGSIG